MAEIVNLNKARKTRQRVDKEKRATENRTKFGRTKAEKEREKKLLELEAKRSGAHKIESEE